MRLGWVKYFFVLSLWSSYFRILLIILYWDPWDDIVGPLQVHHYVISILVYIALRHYSINNLLILYIVYYNNQLFYVTVFNSNCGVSFLVWLFNELPTSTEDAYNALISTYKRESVWPCRSNLFASIWSNSTEHWFVPFVTSEPHLVHRFDPS